MNKAEVLIALKDGKKVRHRFFSDHQYVYLDGDHMVYDDQTRLTVKEFWMHLDGGLAWDMDWEVYSEKVDLKTKNEIVNALTNLKTEFEKNRKVVLDYAQVDEFKQGYKKAMTNIMAILDERIRIIKQDGDLSIRVEAPLVNEVNHYFKIPVYKLKSVLVRLGDEGFLWKTFSAGYPMSKFYPDAINRDYGDMIPVLHIEQTVGEDTGNVYRFVQLTTDKLLKEQGNKAFLFDYNDLREKLNW